MSNEPDIVRPASVSEEELAAAVLSANGEDATSFDIARELLSRFTITWKGAKT